MVIWWNSAGEHRPRKRSVPVPPERLLLGLERADLGVVDRLHGRRERGQPCGNRKYPGEHGGQALVWVRVGHGLSVPLRVDWADLVGTKNGRGVHLFKEDRFGVEDEIDRLHAAMSGIVVAR
jgi:hypothetical protein